ncbi:MAG: tRNA (adenosine(37)-N6)-threonylcarbamoyltransferase complex transferase subunit TsaD [Kiritimatiellae bacterium]|nr:tRNA (adenosine(37)-N6)-threonylcarbamoyltransferase complex transferase subunit TsaD [Kiritimatiellia bacterium]
MALMLGIETSCDETAAAVVESGGRILSNVVHSQIPHHRPYGGVVPEVAARLHAERLPDLIAEALRRAGTRWDRLEGVAVTCGPGLATSLLVGVAAAKALALRLGIRLWGVHHLAGHYESVFHDPVSCEEDREHPAVVLLVSGGHTCLVRTEGRSRPLVVGTTMDDAAGEALDKAARILGLGYPGGPAIESAARKGNAAAVELPRSEIDPADVPPASGLVPELCFSFSGLKTSLLYRFRDAAVRGPVLTVADWAASFQQAVVDALVLRLRRAIERFRPAIVGLAGGVARNARLRSRCAEEAARAGCRFRVAPPELCTDNAAMIASAALAGWCEVADPPEALDVRPSWPLG